MGWSEPRGRTPEPQLCARCGTPIDPADDPHPHGPDRAHCPDCCNHEGCR